MALVTLAQAKAHLRIASTDQDADIVLKAAAASAAVLRYIAGRRIDVSTLTSSGTTATVVTPVAHSLGTGDVVVVWGTDQAAYNGTFTVTVTDANTFTFPVYGSPASPATGYVGVKASQAWTAQTVPADVQHAVLLLLGHLYEHRGDDVSDAAVWEAIGRLLSSYRMPGLA